MLRRHRQTSLVCPLCWLPLLLLADVAAAADPPPPDIPALIAAAGSTDDHPAANIVVALDLTEIDVEPSGLSHVSNRTVTKILTARGAVAQGFQRFDFDPATQLIEVRRVAIHRAGGDVEEIDTAGLVDVEAPAHSIYWGARLLGLDLPRLRPGDAVEIETYRKGFQIAYLAQEAGQGDDDESKYIPPLRGHYYDVVLFQATHPIVDKRYTLRTPRSMPVQYSVYNGEVEAEQTFDADHFTYRFRKRDVPAASREWRSPGLSDYAPKVVLATVADWGAKSRWFEEVNRRQFDSNDEIDAKVAEITDGLGSDEEKIAAINHWVAQNIRYCGLNMGQGEGYTLHSGEMIFRERSGVCKDIAGMSITMLRAAGYEVYPAMTMAGARVERTPADQFNHCVAALRRDDGSFEMLDPTWIPYSRYNWSRAEGEQHYVIGTPAGEDLTAIRPFTADENALVIDIEGRLDETGKLTARIELDTRGYADTRLRRTVGSNPRDAVVPALQAWLAHLAPAARLVKYRFGDPVDWDTAMVLTVEFEIDGYAAVGERVVSWRPLGSRLVMGNLSGMVRFAHDDLPAERKTPTLLWAAQEIRLRERIEVPRGFTVAPPEDPVVAGCETGAGFCDFTWSGDGRRLTLDGRVQATDRTVQVEDWPDFQAAVTAFEELGGTWLTARRKGGRS